MLPPRSGPDPALPSSDTIISPATSNHLPGIRTSTAFFSSLRSNLHLRADTPSPLSTPPSLRSSVADVSRFPPSPLQYANVPVHVPDDFKLPDKHFEPVILSTANGEETVAALALIAATVTDQRRLAMRAILQHPLTFCGLALALWISQTLAYSFSPNILGLAAFWTTVILLGICFFRWLSLRYASMATTIDWDWLGGDKLFVAKVENVAAGAIVLTWDRCEGKSKRKKGAWGWIKAWAVSPSYRRRGLGTALLEDAARVVRRRGGDALEFAEDHAREAHHLSTMFLTLPLTMSLTDSIQVLPNLYDHPFKERDRNAARALSNAWTTRGCLA